jgi:hypothetical protein
VLPLFRSRSSMPAVSIYGCAIYTPNGSSNQDLYELLKRALEGLTGTLIGRLMDARFSANLESVVVMLNL